MFCCVLSFTRSLSNSPSEQGGNGGPSPIPILSETCFRKQHEQKVPIQPANNKAIRRKQPENVVNIDQSFTGKRALPISYCFNFDCAWKSGQTSPNLSNRKPLCTLDSSRLFILLLQHHVVIGLYTWPKSCLLAGWLEPVLPIHPIWISQGCSE